MYVVSTSLRNLLKNNSDIILYFYQFRQQLLELKCVSLGLKSHIYITYDKTCDMDKTYSGMVSVQIYVRS